MQGRVVKSTGSWYLVNGTYDLTYTNPLFDFTVADPVDFTFSNNGPRATAGFRLRFGFFGIHADYTLHYQDVVTVGIAIDVREDN